MASFFRGNRTSHISTAGHPHAVKSWTLPKAHHSCCFAASFSQCHFHIPYHAIQWAGKTFTEIILLQYRRVYFQFDGRRYRRDRGRVASLERCRVWTCMSHQLVPDHRLLPRFLFHSLPEFGLPGNPRQHDEPPQRPRVRVGRPPT